MGLRGLGEIASVIPGATKKSGAKPPKAAGARPRTGTPVGAASSLPAPQGGSDSWSVTGSLSDIFGVVTTIGGMLSPEASLTYNSIAFSAIFEEERAAKSKPGPGEGTVPTKTLRQRTPLGRKDPAFADLSIRTVTFLELRASPKDVAEFEVVFWYDGKDILAGYTQLGTATGFNITIGTTGGVNFAGTAFGKTVPSMFLLTFGGFVDKSGLGNMEFTGSVGIRADGTVKALECQPVPRPLLLHTGTRPIDSVVKSLTAEPLAFSDGELWRIGWKGDEDLERT